MMQTHTDPTTGETLPGSKDERIAQIEADLAAAQAERNDLRGRLHELKAELAARKDQMSAEREDMANVGEALMETIKRNLSPHWSWNDCPSEVVVDLINERDEARAEAVAYQCVEGARCVCGGDTPAVRATCANMRPIKPDPRVAELEELLREAYWAIGIQRPMKPDVVPVFERIDAALKGRT